MKFALNLLGALFLVIGGVWMLQGLNILGGSFMSGQSRWFVIGSIGALVGVGLLALANLRR